MEPGSPKSTYTQSVSWEDKNAHILYRRLCCGWSYQTTCIVWLIIGKTMILCLQVAEDGSLPLPFTFTTYCSKCDFVRLFRCCKERNPLVFGWESSAFTFVSNTVVQMDTRARSEIYMQMFIPRSFHSFFEKTLITISPSTTWFISWHRDSVGTTLCWGSRVVTSNFGFVVYVCQFNIKYGLYPGRVEQCQWIRYALYTLLCLPTYSVGLLFRCLGRCSVIWWYTPWGDRHHLAPLRSAPPRVCQP